MAGNIQIINLIVKIRSIALKEPRGKFKFILSIFPFLNQKLETELFSHNFDLSLNVFIITSM